MKKSGKSGTIMARGRMGGFMEDVEPLLLLQL